MVILLVDDHPLFREGVVQVLGKVTSDIAVHQAHSCEEALEFLTGTLEFDLVLLDLMLPGMDGLDGLKCIRRNHPGTPVVVLSATEAPSTVRSALEAGAQGYIPKSTSPKIMLQAIHLVLEGGVYAPHDLLDHRPASDIEQPAVPLTPRQRQVLKLLSEGRSNKEIAHRLSLSENTVRVHVAAILKTLKVRNRTEAALTAARLGISTPDTQTS